MTALVRRCFALSAGLLVISTALLVAGVPGSLLLGFAPVLACVGMHVLMGHSSHHDALPQGADRPFQE